MGNSRSCFYIPVTIVAITIYRNTWLPGSMYIQGKENYIILYLAVLYILFFIDLNKFLTHKMDFSNLNLKLYLVMFLIFVISIAFYNFQEVIRIDSLVKLLVLLSYIIIYFIIVPVFVFQTSNFKSLVAFISKVGFVFSLFGLLLLGIHFNPYTEYSGYMISIMYHPNYFPFIVNFGILTTIFYFQWQKKNLTTASKSFFIASVFIQFVAVLLTFSRQAYIAIGLDLVVYFVMFYRLKFILLIPVFVSAFVMLIPYFVAKGFGSFLSRFFLLVPAYHLIQDSVYSMLLGNGYTNSLRLFSKFNDIHGGGEIMNNPHNSLISMIIIFGIPFCIVFGIYILSLFFKLLIKLQRCVNKEERLLYSFIFSFFTIMFALNLFESVLVQIEYFNIQIFLLFLAILTKLTSKRSNYFLKKLMT